MAEHDLMTGEVTGVIQVDDWVRELPATHFQPCSCCLCRPPGGTRPIFRVRAIEREQGRTYFRFDGEQRYPAEEFERVDPPAKGADPVVIRNDPAANAALLREPEALARMRSLLREMGALMTTVRGWTLLTFDYCLSTFDLPFPLLSGGEAHATRSCAARSSSSRTSSTSSSPLNLRRR